MALRLLRIFGSQIDQYGKCEVVFLPDFEKEYGPSFVIKKSDKSGWAIQGTIEELEEVFRQFDEHLERLRKERDNANQPVG